MFHTSHVSPFQSKHLCHFIIANLVFWFECTVLLYLYNIAVHIELQDELINKKQINIKLLARSPILHFALSFLNLAVGFEILVDLIARFPTCAKIKRMIACRQCVYRIWIFVCKDIHRRKYVNISSKSSSKVNKIKKANNWYEKIK